MTGTHAAPEVRFFRLCHQEGDCWVWNTPGATGYGTFWPGTGRMITAHRWAYEFLIGEIPDGLELDHLCRVRACVNPYHLDPVTREVNAERKGARKIPETCKHGHSFATHGRPVKGTNRKRYCSECKRIRGRVADRRRRDAKRTGASE